MRILLDEKYISRLIKFKTISLSLEIYLYDFTCRVGEIKHGPLLAVLVLSVKTFFFSLSLSLGEKFIRFSALAIQAMSSGCVRRKRR